MNQSMSITAAQQQKLAISGRQMQGLKLLAMSLPELRAEIAAESSNLWGIGPWLPIMPGLMPVL